MEVLLCVGYNNNLYGFQLFLGNVVGIWRSIHCIILGVIVLYTFCVCFFSTVTVTPITSGSTVSFLSSIPFSFMAGISTAFCNRQLKMKPLEHCLLFRSHALLCCYVPCALTSLSLFSLSATSQCKRKSYFRFLLLRTPTHDVAGDLGPVGSSPSSFFVVIPLQRAPPVVSWSRKPAKV